MLPPSRHRNPALALRVASDRGDDEVMASINTTPLVDVMLVLLIIFLITIPVVTQSIAVQLPREVNVPRQTRPDHIDISVNQDGEVFWNTQSVADSEALFQRLEKIAVMTPQPEVQIRGDQHTRYESIGRVVNACQRAGVQRVSFVTEPPPKES
jgi:biopolymer transport protein ExbD